MEAWLSILDPSRMNRVVQDKERMEIPSLYNWVPRFSFDVAMEEVTLMVVESLVKPQEVEDYFFY
jgi:hypothetical protein